MTLMFLLFIFDFGEVGVFNGACGAAGLAFVLHLVQLPFQLVNEFVNGRVHIFMFGAGDQMAVRRIDGGVRDEPWGSLDKMICGLIR